MICVDRGVGSMGWPRYPNAMFAEPRNTEVPKKMRASFLLFQKSSHRRGSERGGISPKIPMGTFFDFSRLGETKKPLGDARQNE